VRGGGTRHPADVAVVGGGRGATSRGWRAARAGVASRVGGGGGLSGGGGARKVSGRLPMPTCGWRSIVGMARRGGAG